MFAPFESGPIPERERRAFEAGVTVRLRTRYGQAMAPVLCCAVGRFL
jgi:hypothetical protein